MTARRDTETLDYEEKLEKAWEAEERRRQKLLHESAYTCGEGHRTVAMDPDDDGWWSCPRCGRAERDIELDEY
jgi:hypothetical protein